MGILAKIRQKSDQQKKVFSLVTALILTAVIVVVWFSFNNVSFNGQMPDGSDKLSSVSPIQMIKDEFSKAFSNFNNNVSDLEASSTTITN